MNEGFEKFVNELAEKQELVAGSPEQDEIYLGDVLRMAGRDVGYVVQVNDESVIAEVGGSSVCIDKKNFDGISIPLCDSCSNEKVYNDSSEEWLCPFCEL